MRLPDGTYSERVDDTEEITRGLVAGAAPMYPPKSWFEDPQLDRVTPITITADGRVYGHIADWNRDHMGLPPGTNPPHSATDYAFFKTGAIKTSEGDELPVGNLTLAGGHAPLNASAGDAVEHYDNTASAVADVAVGEDRHGIWVNGGLRPNVDEGQVRALRASAPSGDWRPINGQLELVAICQVNTPGFPIARTMVASGQITALVAAGASHMYELQQERSSLMSLEALETRVNELESVVAAGPKKTGAPKSDNSTDAGGDDADAHDAGKGSDAGEPVEDSAADKKEDATEVNNDNELNSNKGKNPPRKPVLPAAPKKKKSLVAGGSPKALTAAKVVRTQAGARRWKVPIGTVLDGSGKPVSGPQKKASLGAKPYTPAKGHEVKVSTTSSGIHGKATVARTGTKGGKKYYVVKGQDASGNEKEHIVSGGGRKGRIEKFDEGKAKDHQGAALRRLRSDPTEKTASEYKAARGADQDAKKNKGSSAPKDLTKMSDTELEAHSNRIYESVDANGSDEAKAKRDAEEARISEEYKRRNKASETPKDKAWQEYVKKNSGATASEAGQAYHDQKFQNEWNAGKWGNTAAKKSMPAKKAPAKKAPTKKPWNADMMSLTEMTNSPSTTHSSVPDMSPAHAQKLIAQAEKRLAGLSPSGEMYGIVNDALKVLKKHHGKKA